ncbi:TerC family protein [Effusibacillus pohliae]|uniref:TerC family protein n=1 Tax=Effusibacillus pohliae TaxID=232270 RepID=UPI0003778AF0|nr:TerC family protein [Effusibacillus pohliae]
MWELLVAFFSIIIINLVLSGDNAIVIALASRKLPLDKRRQAILWGTAGAIVLRIVLTLVVVWLLKIPFLMVAGGLMLIWISYKLLIDKEEGVEIKAANNLWQAIQTIVVADFVMSLDNVLAIAGAANGKVYLVVIGILLSIPVIVWGSTMILKLIEKYPAIVYIGSGILAYTAGEMIVGDQTVNHWVHGVPGIHYIVPIATAVLVLAAGHLMKKRGPIKQEGISNSQ